MTARDARERVEDATAGPDAPHRWHPGWLLLGCGVAALLCWSWFGGWLRPGWDRVDEHVFFALNGSLAEGDLWRWLWAAANTRLKDAVTGALFAAIFAVYIWRGGLVGASRRLAQGMFVAAYTVLVLDVSSNYLFTFERLSPSLVLEPAHRIYDVITAVKVKDASGNSFPGDHGTAVLMFTGLIAFFCGRRYALFAAALAFVAIWPRLVAGAHWLSDLGVGSASIALVALSVALATPVAAVLTGLATRLLRTLATPLVRSGWLPPDF
ncbi:MAG: phosphatase PAP2 family protein [Pseudomonadota bacterium]